MKTFMRGFIISFVIVLTGCTTTTPNTSSTQNLATENQIQLPKEIEDGEELEDSTYDLNSLIINANGTEPFWNFSASGANLTWTEPSFAGPINTTTYTISMNQTPTTITAAGPGINALLTLETCSNGMSDIIYSHKVTVTKGVDVYLGCANITP